MDKNQGYAILKAVMLENGRGFALGEHPRAPSPFVTWACYDDEHGVRQYEWGHYGSDRAALERDLLERVENYQQQFSVKVAQIEAPGLYKYYSTQRPVDIGTFPKPAGNAPDGIVNYDKRVPVEGGAFLAWGHLTYTKPLTEKQAAGLSAVQTMEERFAYGLNPQKLGAVSSYLCDPATAAAEFLLVKSEYQAATARPVERGALFFQIRQAFPPGEVTADEANKIGYETAMRWTKGKYQFFVCTHTDKGHIHNHIYFNSTAFDCSRKFHNFLGSSFALRRLSDRVCLEHDLSVIQNPKQHSKGRFLHYGQWVGEKPLSAQQRVRLAIIAALEKKPADFAAFFRLMEESGFAVKRGRGGVVSFLAPGQDKYTRLRASTLGAGFDPEDIRAVIAGERPLPELPKDAPPPARQVGLIIDIQQRMAEGKGPAYERWAKVYNLKQMAAALQFLQENNLTDYDALAAKTTAAVDRAHALAGELQTTEAALSKVSGLMGAVVDYAKTRPVFDGYKAARYSKKYLAEHEEALASYRAAKAAINDILDGAKLPRMDALKKQRRELADKKKALYAEYRQAQRDMRQAVAVKANIDHLLGLTDGRTDKEQTR